MKFLRVILSLHSIQLIVISTLLLTYLAVTGENAPNKTETVQETSSAEGKSADHGDAEPLTRARGIKAMILQPTARGKILKLRAALKTKRASAQAVTVREEGNLVESFESESATAAGQVLQSPRPTTRER